MFISTKCFPLKYLIKPAAGYTTRLVPATIRQSADEIAATAPFIVLVSRLRSVYKELHADRETGC